MSKSNNTAKLVAKGRKLVNEGNAKARKARSPKAGSAQRNQSVTGVKAKADNDTITSVNNLRTGNGAIATAGSATCVIAPWQDKGTTRKLAVEGGSLAALRAHLATLVKPEAKLARGVDSHNSPHSAKAVADNRATASKGDKPAKQAKVAAPKAEKNKQPSRGAERSYTVAKGTENKARPDSWRHHMTAMIIGNTDTASAKAAHAKSKKFPANKLDFNWAATQGFIKFAK